MRLAWWLGLLALAGCRCSSPDTPESVMAWKQARIDHARLLALADNRFAYQADLENKYAGIWKGLRIEQRIPYAPDTEAFRSRLIDLAQAHDLELSAFEATELTVAPVETPPRVGPNQRIDWSDARLLREHRVEFDLHPLDLGRLEAWFRGRGRVERAFLVDEVSFGAKRATLELRVFHFVERPPVPTRVQPVLEAAVEGDGEKALAARKLCAEVNARLDEINQALAYRTEAELWDARYAIFERLDEETRAQKWSDVLR